MAKRMTDKEIREFINSKSVTQENYVAPTVKTHITSSPAMTQVSKPKTVESTVTLKDAISNYNDVLNNGYVRNKGLSWDNLITDLANQSDARKQVYESIPVIGGLFKAKNTAKKTAANIATNMGEGAIKATEGVADTLSDLVFNPQERARNYVIDYITKGKKVADENLKDLKQQQQEDIKRNLTKEFLKKIGYEDYVDEFEKDSLVKRENIGGQVAQGIGGMIPSLVLGQAFGGTTALKDLKELKGVDKLKAAAQNVATTYKNQMPSNLTLGAQSYGSGVEEALNEGATMDQARKFGLANAAIEQGTEMMTGGVPGLGGKNGVRGFGGLDALANPLIDKTGNGYINALLKTGYGAFGEGLEEYAAEMLNPLARKIYSDEPIDWDETRKRARQAGLVGGITGAFLNSPNTVSDFNEARIESRANKQNANNNIQETQKVDNVNKETKGIENEVQETKPKENRVNDHTLEYNGYYIMSEKPNVGYDYKSLEDSNRFQVYDANNDDITHNVGNWINSIEDAKDYIDTIKSLDTKTNEQNNTTETIKDKTITLDEIGQMGQDYFDNLDNKTKQDGTSDSSFNNENIAAKKDNKVLTLKNKKGQELNLKQDKNNPNVYEKEQPKTYGESIVPKETIDKQMAKLKNGTKISNFYSNIAENSKFLTQENMSKLSQEEIWKYAPQTNKETMQKAVDKIGDTQKSLENSYADFLSKTDNFTPEDVAEGWIYLKRFQDAGNYEAMVQVAKKMRNIATKSGQTVQMFNLQSRLTPEGMVKYAQSELMEAEQIYNEGKSKKQIEKAAKNFELTGDEVEFIKNQMEKIQGMEDGRAKDIEMAKINKMLSDKLPHQKGDSIKGWMRLSMLFNPKTQVRNIAGNALITPINAIADIPGALVDKAISKKTGVRTLGAPTLESAKTYAQGFKRGGVEAWQDYKMGIDTKDVDMSRFDINQSKPFVDTHEGLASVLNPISKGLNWTNDLLDLAMSGGDRVFYQGAFDSSLRNQMALNNVDTPTQDMIDIARQEALSRTWNDSNGYTQFVLNTRRALNKVNAFGYGLGDVLIPFAKTPANLTKAIVDYSPVGMADAIFKTKNIKNTIETGQITPQMQHDFAQKLGKGVAGTLLYGLGYALAKSGITTGSKDDDKDVANFIQNTMGIQPYSIKIGDKSFTYDWAQPIAAPIAITADAYKNLTRKSDESFMKRVMNTMLDVANTGINVLLQQSFLQGISEVLNNNEGVANGIMEQVMGLPARAIPTFAQQINNMFDKTQRVSYENDEPITTAWNQMLSKTPFSKTLAPKVDTLGNEVQRYGGDKNEITYFLKNFLSPTNQSNKQPSEVADAIYDVYENTGDKTIMPMVAPYYIQNKTVGRIDLNSQDRAKYQKTSGKIVSDAMNELLADDDYNNLSYEQKAEIISGIVGFANAKAKEEFTGMSPQGTYSTANKKVNSGMSIADYYLEKTKKKR